MDVLTFRWVTVIAKYLQSETVADLFYVTCFCNVYAWILIKYKLHFDFLVVFTLLLRPCQLLYHVSWLLYYWSPFFVLTSGRSLPETTFFVFSKPLCSHFAAQIVIREFSAPLQKRCFIAVKGLSTASKICGCCSPALLQLCCSASWSHSAALLVSYGYKSVNLFFEELINIKVILFLIHELFAWENPWNKSFF